MAARQLFVPQTLGACRRLTRSPCRPEQREGPALGSAASRPRVEPAVSPHPRGRCRRARRAIPCGSGSTHVLHGIRGSLRRSQEQEQDQGQEQERGTAPTSSGSPRVVVGLPVARHAVRPRRLLWWLSFWLPLLCSLCPLWLVQAVRSVRWGLFSPSSVARCTPQRPVPALRRSRRGKERCPRGRGRVAGHWESHNHSG
jgi:hypothetical protein